ncbi:hypothetical protein FQZ97_390470 [compost metagenome]
MGLDEGKVLLQEHLYMQNTRGTLDSQTLTLKIWSTTFGLTILIASSISSKPEISFATIISGLLFWLVESNWRSVHDAHHRHARDLEIRLDQKTRDPSLSSTQSCSLWSDSHRPTRNESFLRNLLSPQVALPHLLIAFLGSLYFYISTSDQYTEAFASTTAAIATTAKPAEGISVKDLVTTIATIIGVPTALLAAWKAIIEFREGNVEKRRENRLKQASAAKIELESLFSDPMARAAMQMLDWSGRSHNTGTKYQPIFFNDLGPGLRTFDLTLNERDAYIRDCFEKFFDHLSMIEHLISIDYINFEDIAVPVRYYAKKIIDHRHAYDPFLDAYGYDMAKRFIERAAKSAT